MRRLLPIVTLALVLLAGCSGEGEPEPRIAPSDSSSAASSTAPPPSPTGPVEPTLPAEAQGEDAAAAEAFVRFYWETVNYAQATGDVEGLRAIGAESCDGCRGGLEGIVETYEAGGRIEGGEMRVRSAKATQISSPVATAYSVKVSARAAPQTIIESPGGEPIAKEGGRFKFQFIVQNDETSWSVYRWDVM